MDWASYSASLDGPLSIVDSLIIIVIITIIILQMRKMILREGKGSFRDHIVKQQEVTFESRFLALKSMLFPL